MLIGLTMLVLALGSRFILIGLVLREIEQRVDPRSTVGRDGGHSWPFRVLKDLEAKQMQLLDDPLGLRIRQLSRAKRLMRWSAWVALIGFVVFVAGHIVQGVLQALT